MQAQHSFPVQPAMICLQPESQPNPQLPNSEGAAVPKWLPLWPVGAAAAVGISSGEGDICPLLLRKILTPTVGLLQSLLAN